MNVIKDAKPWKLPPALDHYKSVYRKDYVWPGDYSCPTQTHVPKPSYPPVMDLPERYQPEHRPEHSPEYQPEYQPVYQLEHRPEHRPEYQPVYRLEYQPVYRLEYRPECRPECRPKYRPEHRPKYRPEYQLEHQPERRPECRPCRPEYQLEHRPEYQLEHQPERRPECRPCRPEYQLEHRPECWPVYRPEYQLEHRPERRPECRPCRPEYQPEHRPECRPCRPEYRPEYRPEHRPEYRPEHRPECWPVYRPEYRPSDLTPRRVGKLEILAEPVHDLSCCPVILPLTAGTEGALVPSELPYANLVTYQRFAQDLYREGQNNADKNKTKNRASSILMKDKVRDSSELDWKSIYTQDYQSLAGFRPEIYTEAIRPSPVFPEESHFNPGRWVTEYADSYSTFLKRLDWSSPISGQWLPFGKDARWTPRWREPTH